MGKIKEKNSSATVKKQKAYNLVVHSKKNIRSNNHDAESYKNLGNIELQKGEFEKALSYYQKALVIDPAYALSYNNIGVVFKNQGKLEEAIVSFKKAIKLKSGYAAAYSNLGTVLLQQSKQEEAEKYFRKALELDPNVAKIHYNLGNILLEQRKLQEALSHFKQAIEIDPEYAKAYSNLGVAFRDLGQLDEAYTSLKRALDLNPDDTSYYNLGIVLQDQGKGKEALGCFEHVVRLNPQNQDAYANLINQMRETANWQRIDEFVSDLGNLTKNALVHGQRPGETPFMCILSHDDNKHNFEIARSWSRDIANKTDSHGVNFVFDKGKKKKKIRIGYISNNFREHPVGQLLVGLFEAHNRDNFEIFVYSYSNDDNNPCKFAIASNCDEFIDIKNIGDRQAAQRIYNDKIDILVDLNGHTQENRLQILAFRPAPVQVTYLGFLGTTGADFIDYIITDKIVTPPEISDFYSEKFIYMPYSYQICTYPRLELRSQAKKIDFGLPEDAIVFCSFNRSFKIDNEMFGIWMEILKEVPLGVLWLYRSNTETEENLKNEAKRKGIGPNRLLFVDKLPYKEHLRRLSAADIVLDTRIYNGGATTSDALWAGVPVITLKGHHFASRASNSMLSTLGVKELVVSDIKEYKNLAIKLAKNPIDLFNIKQKIQNNCKTTPLFDTPRFTKNLEVAYKKMWDLYLKGEHPQQIQVKEPKSIEKALKKIHAKEDAKFYGELGDLYLGQGKLDEATENYQKLLDIDNSSVMAYNNLGIAYAKQFQMDKAMAAFKSALLIDPRYEKALVNQGAALKEQGRLSEAVKVIKNALPLGPTVEACYNLGAAYHELDKFDEAIMYFKQSIKMNPSLEEAYVYLYNDLRHHCDWDEAEKIFPKLLPMTQKALQKGVKPAEVPFMNVNWYMDPKFNYELAKAWGEDIEERMKPFKREFSFAGRKEKQKIRIGYLSCDFHDHPTAHLMLSLFPLHDKSKFEVFVYSYGINDDTSYRQTIVDNVDKFVDIKDASFLEAAQKIYEDEIDILVDLKGHTRSSRLEICAFRPAPIQATYLGFPGTTGASFFDYAITDSIVVPQDEAAYYTEKLIYLPHCYQVNDDNQRISTKQYKRSDFGLPEKGIVFCSFVQSFKIEPVMFDSWMRILKKVPGSVLWLWKKNEHIEKNLKKEAKRRGVDPKRLIFATKLPKYEHLARLRLADIALDTRIYNGHTTTSDALWAGVPVVTLKGNHFASRVSASILTAIGLPELITNSQKEYERLAVKLAIKKNLLVKLKKKLEINKFTTPLFDTPRFVKNLEKAYETMWSIYSREGVYPSSEWPNNSIVFFCGSQFTSWDPESVDKPGETFVGGSEEAVVYLSRELVKQGFNITVYAQPKKEGAFDGVLWKDYRLFNPNDKYNILVYWRGVGMTDLLCDAKKTYVWCHDVQVMDDYTKDRIARLSKIIVLSEPHRENLSLIDDSKFFISANGFYEHFPKIKSKNNPKWCIYTSSYDRGLEHLLEIWPDVKKEVPDAKLHVFYGWQLFDRFYSSDIEKMAWKRRIEKLLKQPGIIHHARASQAEIEKWYKKCGIFAYPSHFYEISCISAIKAQAFGTVPVATTIGALEETVQYGTKVFGTIWDPKIKEAYKKALIKALKDAKWQDKERKKMMPWARGKYGWDKVAKAWIEEFKAEKALKELSQNSSYSATEATIAEQTLIDISNQFTKPRTWADDEIAIYCGPGVEQWSYKSVARGINESEEAVINISQELAKLGWRVYVYADPGNDAGVHNGVAWFPYYYINWEDQFNILISWEDISMFDIPDLRARKIFLWTQRSPDELNLTPGTINKITKVMFLSKWQRDKMPDLEEDKVMYVENDLQPEND